MSMTTERLLSLHQFVDVMFADSDDPLRFTGEREPGLADAAVFRAFAGSGDRDFYPSVREKTAALVHAINSSHVFRDGNKRTSVAALAVMLDGDGWHLSCDDDELFMTIVAVATPSAPFEGPTDTVIRELTSWIRANTVHEKQEFGDISTHEFLRRCADAGGTYKESGSSWVVSGLTAGSVRISRSTTKLASGVVRSYLSRIGLSEVWTGLSVDQFYGVAPQDLEILARYRDVMWRLARYDTEDRE